jgi:shikimate kinase
MLKNNQLYIIGFMGSGKTTMGLKLAALLGWTFTDLDKSVEGTTGMTIPEIFSIHGEEYFREVESEMLRSLNSGTNSVISTGGGTPCFGDNMDFMLETGLTLYLKLTPGQLKKRLSVSKGERPLLKELSDEDLLKFIEEKLESREKFYNRAKITVDGFNVNVRQIYSVVKGELGI